MVGGGGLWLWSYTVVHRTYFLLLFVVIVIVESETVVSFFKS
jgi:hypothetical protein